MLYDAYQAQRDLLAPFRATAELAAAAFAQPSMGPVANYFLRSASAGAEILSRARLQHERPPYGIDAVTVAGKRAAICEEVMLELPFGSLLHFRKDSDVRQPRVLLAAPMAGHFSTLLRNTAETLLPDHDVYITDWKNARDVPRSDGRFGTEDYIAYLMKFLEALGPGSHAVAVCQPCPALLSAVALMAEDDNPATPRSMTLMAGPVDTRLAPTKVNLLATEHPLEWFDRNFITSVPARYEGAHRLVYPGFLQLSAFLSMNPARHLRAHLDLFGHLARAENAAADVSRGFYDEYFSVADLPAEFYLETVRNVFQEHHLPRGIATWRGRTVDPGAICKTALFTVEAERDDICSLGQTAAAHALCTGIKPSRKNHHVQAGVGHYGVFSGRRWHTGIYPMVRNTILASD